MTDLIHDIVIYALAVFVLLASICRIKAMHPGTHQLLWGLMYMASAAFALAAAFNAARTGVSSYTSLFGLCAWSLNFINTLPIWREGAPGFTVKK